jgi:hypothetical protein
LSSPIIPEEATVAVGHDLHHHRLLRPPFLVLPATISEMGWLQQEGFRNRPAPTGGVLATTRRTTTFVHYPERFLDEVERVLFIGIIIKNEDHGYKAASSVNFTKHMVLSI